MRYVRPKSLSWWAGIAAIAVGGVQVYASGDLIHTIGVLLRGETASADLPGLAMIIAGLGIVGIRDKLERLSASAEVAEFEYVGGADSDDDDPGDDQGDGLRDPFLD